MSHAHLLVDAERERAAAKWGRHYIGAYAAAEPDRAYRVLMEEAGEVARELNDADTEERAVDLDKLRAELIQVAAMATAWHDATLRAPQPSEESRRA